MKPDESLMARIAATDPVRHAGLSELQRHALAARVRQRVLEDRHQPDRHRSRAGIGSLAALAGSILIVIVVAAVVLIGHHRAASSANAQPAHRQTAGTTAGTFVALARRRTTRDRLPIVLRQDFSLPRAPAKKLEINRSALIISTRKQRWWLVPAGQQLCFAQENLTRSGGYDGGSFGCTGMRYAELHGLQLGVSGRTFNAVLPEDTSPVQVTFMDGSSLKLQANANGVITRNFSKPARLISYIGPTGLDIRIRPPANQPRPPCPNHADPAKACK